MTCIVSGKFIKLSVFLIMILSQHTCGQVDDGQNTVPVLSVFQGLENEAVFVVPVGSGETYTLNLFNDDDAAVLTGNVDSVVVTLNGGSELLLESIEADAPPNTTLSQETINGMYIFHLSASGGGTVQTKDYQSLITSLRYVSTLGIDSLSDGSRNITIIAMLSGNSSAPGTAVLMLLMANQHPPVVQAMITTSIDEGVANGSLVIQLAAQDPEGLVVIFSFSTPSPAFSISFSGSITVMDTSLLDYETSSQRLFTLGIMVADTDSISPMTSEAQVTININNINDNPPAFSMSSFNFSVNEAVSNAIVGTLVATDRDVEEYTGNLFFDLLDLGNNDIMQRFQVNRETGVITVLPPGLDFEVTEAFSFGVRVNDRQFIDTAIVNVMVIDIPDNRPVISPANKTILIDLDSAQREIFLTDGSGGSLTVSDSDSATLQDGRATLMVVNGTQVCRKHGLL